jgi:hypothetical protein
MNFLLFSVACLVLITGVISVKYSSEIGELIDKTRPDLKKSPSKKQESNKKFRFWLSSSYAMSIYFAPAFNKWLIRVIGIGFTVGAVLLILISLRMIK